MEKVWFHVFVGQLSEILPSKPSYSRLLTAIIEAILYGSFSIATILILLNYKLIDGNLVPVVFGNMSRAFHAFVVSVIFAFTSSLSALATHQKPTAAVFFSCCSIVSAASALAFFMWAMFGGGSQTLSDLGNKIMSE